MNSAHAARADERAAHDLLLLTARTTLDQATDEQVLRCLRVAIDWPSLIGIAAAQGTVCLLHTHVDRLVRSGQATVPEEVRTELRAVHEAVAFRNLHLDGELHALLREFHAQGVPALPLKGPVLATTVYGNLSLRMFADLDILVRDGDFARAAAMLQARGYAPEHRRPPAQERRLRVVGHEESFVRPDEKVELQWAVANRLFGVALPLDDVWSRTRTGAAGSHVTLLSPEDLLVLLCIHGSTHAWERLVWVSDVAELLRRSLGGGVWAIDWSLVRRIATDARVARRVRLGLHLAATWLDAPLPDEVQRWVTDDPVVMTLAWRLRQWFPGTRVTMRSLRFHLPSLDANGDRMRFVWRALFTATPDDWSVVPLPGFATPLYSLVRPLRLVAGLIGRPRS